MSGQLARQVQVFDSLRPKLLENHQSGWVLIAREKLIEIFDEYSEASNYADDHFPEDEILIRQLAEQRHIVPFIVPQGE